MFFRSVQYCTLAIFISLDPTLSKAGEYYADIKIKSADIHVSIDGQLPSLSKDQIINWTKTSALAVEKYYQKFPLKSLSIMFQKKGNGKAIQGTAYGGPVPYIIIKLNDRFSYKEAKTDWVLVHEMVHLALPNLDRRHHWLEEGLATYIEPFARRDFGLVDKDHIWRWLTQGLPNAVNDRMQRGLDNTRTWAQTYWGSTLFCFLADIKIRERSKGEYALQDAVIGIQNAGGDISQSWSIEKVLEQGDLATKGNELMELYFAMGKKQYEIDLGALWQELGIQVQKDGRIKRYNAPKSWVRDLIDQNEG